MIANIDQGVTIAADAAVLAAPIVSACGEPAIGAAMQILAPIAMQYIIKGGDLIISFRKDLTPGQLIAALQAAHSANWPEPPPITKAA